MTGQGFNVVVLASTEESQMGAHCGASTEERQMGAQCGDGRMRKSLPSGRSKERLDYVTARKCRSNPVEVDLGENDEAHMTEEGVYPVTSPDF